MDMLKNGTHVLVTDIDNIFNRYVPLHGFLEEGFDVYHTYEMKFPTHIYFKTRFVVCGGHSFSRASPETMRYMVIVFLDKCNDQITLITVLFNSLDVKWDNDDPNHAIALRINTTLLPLFRRRVPVPPVDPLIPLFRRRSPRVCRSVILTTQ